MEKLTNWYLHVDLDAFFASVEQLDHPEYRGKPVIVGGLPEDKRSVVSTASYEARKFGVHSAMPTIKAYQLCPQGIYVRGNYTRYSELSYQIMSIFKEYSPDVNQMSIDEAFIDLTGTEKLFGPPEETALKIKAHVKKNTGLTVSVGLATTKYLAKIASGFSKPDGFYFVKPGTEQEFMLNLPLTKVWGVGDKGQEKLKNSGIRTTRDIYEKSFDSLEFLFGTNTATFLYNVVRGIDTEGFGTEAKKHSISAESTFSYDVTDIYTAETKLLELCHGVVFRLIRENSFSRTAFLKIRYDDFSTVSIQETVDRSILTVDSFFEIIKRLFEKKYENGRGIRLLGVGFDNIVKEDKPYQQDLFESSNEKKQAVEKAILKLEKKHPEIKVQKARTLHKNIKAIVIVLLSTLLFAKPTKIQAQEVFETEKVDYIFEGYWQGAFKDTFSLSFGNNTPLLGSFSSPIFTQEVDLSTWILLNKKWYFEADFADNFDKNTIAFGYNGNGYLKSARISNRGITIPPLYSSNAFGFGLSGGTNQAPGISLHFADLENSTWFGDFILRYDMTKINSATFYGKNSITDSTLEPQDFLYGKYFVIPQTVSSELSQIKNIYVEDKSGTIRDKNGRKYKKLSSSDYIVYENTGKIVFSNNCGTSRQSNKIPVILMTFTNEQSISAIISATGSYSDKNSFAGNIQEYFNTYTDTAINLEEYSYNLQTEIENEPALILQNSAFFSPFLCANTYDCGLITQADVIIQNVSSEKINEDYITQILENDVSELTNDFIFENHLYVQVFNNNYNDKSLQKPENRYPFADISPETYLNLPSKTDTKLIVRSYSPVSEFQIDSEAIEGTLQVYINGILDTQAQYNPETKVVTLSREVSDTDKVYMVWEEDSSNFAGGALAAGSGLFINITPELSMDFSLTSRLPVAINEKFATADEPIAGFAAFTSGVNYSKNGFTISEKTAVSVNTDNATGKLLVLEQSDSFLETYYLSNSDGFQTLAEPYITSADYTLLQENNKTIISHGGITDSKISGYKIPLSWDFSEVSETDAEIAIQSGTPFWAAVDVNLENGNLLKNSSNLEIALQSLIPPEELCNYQFYLQLGINADSDYNGEDTHSIPCWNITDSVYEANWQVINISVTDIDRARLVSDYDARLIVVYSPVNFQEETASSKKGTVFFGPYEPLIQSFFTEQNKYIPTNVYPDQKTSKLTWTVTDTDRAYGQSQITAFSYFSEADFSNYKSLNLDFTVSDCGSFSIQLCSEEETALELNFPNISDVISTINPDDISYTCHKLTVNLETSQVFIDDMEVLQEFYSLNINKKVIPQKLVITIDTLKNDEIIKNGTAYIGNLTYSDSIPYGQAKNYFYTKYEKDNNFIELSSTQGIVTNQVKPVIEATAATGFTLTGIRYEADVTTSKIAGHNIHTEKPLFSFLTFGENYRFNSPDKSLNKKDNLGLDFINPYAPLKLNFETSAKEQNKKRTQDSKGQSNFEVNIGKTTVGLGAKAVYVQKINSDSDKMPEYNTDNYFKGWYDISKLEFSTGNEFASSRTQTYSSNLYTKLPFINLRPEIEYELQALYQNLSETTVDDLTTLAFKLPFSLEKNSFNFLIKRTGGGICESSSGGNYFSDGQYITQSFNKRTWFYSTIPFYDLFENNLCDKISNHTPATEIATYNTMYEANWKRKLFNTAYDLIIPSASSLSLSRDLKGGIAQNDLYQIKAVVTNTALNCFGKQSVLKLFDWYNQDEFISNITGAIQIPGTVSSDPSVKNKFTLSAFEQILFYITDDAVLQTGLDCTFDTTGAWNTKANLLWSRPGQDSIIVEIGKRISKKIEQLPYSIARKELLSCSFGHNTDRFAQQYEYTHGVDVTFRKNLTINTEIGTIFSKTKDAACNLGFNVSLGAKLSF